MEVSLDAAVMQALGAQNLNQAMQAQTAVLQKTLEAEQAVAADLLKMMGVGKNLNAVA